MSSDRFNLVNLYAWETTNQNIIMLACIPKIITCDENDVNEKITSVCCGARKITGVMLFLQP
jgi:hypothetical protein